MRALLTLVLAAALAAPATAAPRLVRLQDGPPIVTDRERFAIEVQGQERVLVVDTVTGARFAVDPPAPSCFYGAAGGGHLMWECSLPDLRSTPRMFDLVARREVDVGGREEFEMLSDASGTNGVGLVGWTLRLGATWLEGVAEPCYHCEQYFFLNWRTGEMRDALGGARDVQDLDTARGHRRACAPLRRRLLRPVDDSGTYQPPWTRLAQRRGWTLGRGELRRCGSRRAVRVGERAKLTDRHALWFRGRTLVIHELATGRRHERRIPFAAPFQKALHVTGTRAYVTEGASERRRRWRLDLR